MNIQTSFQILGLSRSASPEAAKTAYRKLVKTYHPDRFTNDPGRTQAAEEKIKQINNAYGHIKSHFSTQPSAFKTIVKDRGHKPSPVKPKPFRIHKKRNAASTSPGVSRPKAETAFKTIFEQALRAEQCRPTERYARVSARSHGPFQKISRLYPYAAANIMRERAFGPIQAIRPVRPVGPSFR